MTGQDLTARLAKPRFPRSSRYDAHWIVENLMGPHVLWLTEYLCEILDLKPGMRVLDLGCGKAISSIFLAKEFGVHIVAADLWVKPRENARRIAAAGVVMPGLAREIAEVPPHFKPFWEWDFCCFHSPDWWRHHWAKTGLVTVETADAMLGGHALWLDWYRAVLPHLTGFHAKSAADGIAMLEADTEKLFGFTRAVARRDAAPWISGNALDQ